VTALDTPAEAYRRAVEAEKDNMALYERLLAATREPDVRRVLQNLPSASHDRHLPAFDRCIKEALIKSFDGLRTNGKILIPFVVSSSNALLSLSKGMNGIHLFRSS
jgi:hypothetical protein